MLDAAITRLELAKGELMRAMNLLAPDAEVMQRIANVGNDIRQIIADLEKDDTEPDTIPSDEAGNSRLLDVSA